MLRNWPGYEGTLAQPLPDEASRAAQNQEVSEADASSDESMSGANYTQPFRTWLSVRSSTQRSGDHLSHLSWGGTGCLRPPDMRVLPRGSHGAMRCADLTVTVQHAALC